MNLVSRTFAGALRGAAAMALVDGARALAATRLHRRTFVGREQLVWRTAAGALAGALTGGRGLRRGLVGAALLIAAAELARRRLGLRPERRERRLARAVGFVAFGLLAGATLRRRRHAHAEESPPLPRPLPRAWSRDRVDEMSNESFPASDPPSFTPGHC